MKNITFFKIILFLIITFFSCSDKSVPKEYHSLLEKAFIEAGDNATELEKAIRKTPKEQRRSAAFLIAYMPPHDLKTLTADYILDNIQYACKARNEFRWCKNLPDSIFLNEVLPYACINERRDNWRPDFYNRFKPLVESSANLEQAIDIVNRQIKDLLKVSYNTKRRKADQSPYESIEQGMASCTGLSILLVNAFRSVGIPARFTGTPMWTNMSGNHSWVEVWIDGKWYSTEYYPAKEGFDSSWLMAYAGRADPEKPQHWIYATTYKPTNLRFLLPWHTKQKIHAINVTDRYTKIYQQRLQHIDIAKDDVLLQIVMYAVRENDAKNSDDRISEKIVVKHHGKIIDFGFTPAPYEDMNRYLSFKLKKNKTYQICIFGNNVLQKTISYKSVDNKKQDVMVLYKKIVAKK